MPRNRIRPGILALAPIKEEGAIVAPWRYPDSLTSGYWGYRMSWADGAGAVRPSPLSHQRLSGALKIAVPWEPCETVGGEHGMIFRAWKSPPKYGWFLLLSLGARIFA
jgi:hypothetical protein